MATLNSTQRSFLEKTIVKARQLSEAGALKALQNLAINQPEPFHHMDTNQRTLRRRLRSKARLLGDEIINGKQQKIDHLSYELAYEYWHKMLFAKFLEANNLLIHPVHQISVSFEECDEFAREEDYPDKWTAAAHYASHMLPAIFRPEDPLMQVEFSTEDRLALEQLLESIEEEIFIAGDSLGWVYQFWQSEEKERINKSEDKIGGEKLPAVTQLFTEPYMVHFLIDNSIGAWWVSRHPGEKPPVEFEYLRLLDDGTPAAGNFEGWPDETKYITTLDPCMGSGHFIVELFNILAPLRMHEEDFSKEDATRKVITDNLHGLEIDTCCTQIAAFNLALTAWKFNGKHIELPELNLACSGIAPTGKKMDWVKLVGNIHTADKKQRLENGIGMLYDLFQQAPELGSLIDPSTIKPDAFTAGFDELLPVLKKALEIEANDEAIERGVVASGIARAGQILSNKYTLQITNVPYLFSGKQDKFLADYAINNFKNAKGDLATIFLSRMLKITEKSGVVSSVMPQNWLSLKSYMKFRKGLHKNFCWSFIIRLGTKGFQTSMWDFNVMLIAIKNIKPNESTSFSGLDVSEATNVNAKSEMLLKTTIKTLNQFKQLENPDSIVTHSDPIDGSLLNEFSYSYHGLTTGDLPRMSFAFWELEDRVDIWIPFQGTSKQTKHFGGCESLLRWNNGEGPINELLGARKDGTGAWNKTGVIISQMGDMPANLYCKSAFDNNTAVIIPDDEAHLPAIWCFCSSPSYKKLVKVIDQSLAVTSTTMAKIPFDLVNWQKVAEEKYPNGLPDPYSEDPTQWFFHGHPKPSENPLQVTISRLLCYQWPAEKYEEMELADEARQYIKEIKVFDHLADEDGIVCIPSVNGEQPAAERLRDFIKEVWQEDWDNNTISNLLRQAGSKKPNLEQWLREEFFEQHIKLFHNRPFIWHIWDGRKDGFSALVNYHKLDKANLQKLIYTYLGDWIRQCEHKVRNNESGAEGLRLAARKLKDQLILILEGEPPYDVFVRWKPLEKQPIGWEPDINDGVRLNIYPFIQAGILKKKSNIKWGKDRGKNPPGTSWGPDRYNRYEDLANEYKLKDEQGKIIAQLTNEIKRKARDEANKNKEDDLK